ncbi:MAG: RHS repeat-associated core domain-containing protein, partial [Bacteroidales bacterium]|nr:RHS repeat-associated core domain-containing protein [Bacteroidales bacterium]
AGNIKAQYNYYPFGKQWEDPNLMANTNRYTFSGKEKQTVRDLGFLDFGARMLETEIGRWFVIDPLAEKYYSVSPYVYCGNNPVNRIDPNGMEWLNKRDEEYAKQLIEEMRKRIEAEQKSIDELNVTIAKNKEEGKDVSNYQTDVAAMQANIDNLNTGITELKSMGETAEQKFTYKNISGNIGGTDVNRKGVIVMEIANNGSITNGIHESAHGYDLWKGGKNTAHNWDAREIKAYKRQFSYDSSSIPNSYWGKVNGLQDITTKWVYGIYNNANTRREYIYVKYLLQGKVKRTNSEIEQWLDDLRK